MAKGADAVLKKKNRSRRKKLRSNEPVSARIAAVIASKKRRKAGKRRICEGMCFSLPTPEDPFNDRNDPKLKKEKSSILNKKKNNQKNTFVTEDTVMAQHEDQEPSSDRISNNCPSKFFGLCLNSIQNAWTEESFSDECINLMANAWGFKFWKTFATGSDILVESRDCASNEQIAWAISLVSDSIVRKEKEGSVIPSPYLLFLVSSQEEAVKVRSICKALKELGVHTVSLHSGAALAHQVHGLKSCEPEFVISTPERLLDLVLLKAINISEVSFLIVDGLKNFVSNDLEHKIKSIKTYISGTPQTIVFGGRCGNSGNDFVQSLIREPSCRVSP